MFLLPHGATDPHPGALAAASPRSSPDEETTPELPTFFAAPHGGKSAAAQPPVNSRLRVGGGRLLAAGPGRARAGAARKIFSADANQAAQPATPQSDADVPLPSALARGSAAAALAAATRKAPAPCRDLRKPTRDRRDVAVSFLWKGGGASVAVVGSFTEWTHRIPMVADGANSHFVTLHLRAGEHKYLFEVNGVLCVADEQPLIDVPRGTAPASVVNVVEVDDGREFESDDDGGAAAQVAVQPKDAQLPAFGAMEPFGWSALGHKATAEPEYSSTVPANLIRMWLAPPALPAHLHALHGVQRRPARRPTRAGPTPPCHVDLHHLRFERTAAPSSSEAGDSSSGITPGALAGGAMAMSDESACPARRSPVNAPAHVPTTKITTTARWREKRVTAVLYKPQPPRRADVALCADGARRTASSCELPRMAEPAAGPASVDAMEDSEDESLPAETMRTTIPGESSRTPSDVSMAAEDEEPLPAAPTPHPVAPPSAVRALFAQPAAPAPAAPMFVAVSAMAPMFAPPGQPGLMIAPMPGRTDMPMSWQGVNVASVLGGRGR
mmetsp:Transcript_4246/g.10990  ORF Transcript_4246/g.10990 Transcript_4246/m.10990 type:complete len:556 (+) Transcript_4246:97-1764(+)|eukprot:CAMPEP_0119414510 /NCGR_PEP_ID=MMETSP1335-20130426/7032_1 /TAXON_ID=259385 /ORGANISM="Chrysoculter rhomboideus, Strain RCC1486" /LENGTH=555 /DNA_ID=CAMNT_0007439391 /DNA_START=59 /DNA_END=1726 /DNA_ORIENTATION=-